MKLQRTLTENLARGTVLTLGVTLVSAGLTPAALADQFHYNNVLIGPRATGLGGAFTGVSDDASGVYYNPAGLAFALSNDVQGSANAFYGKEAEYKKTLGSDAFVEESSGSLSPFFGGLQKLDRYVERLVFAFGVYTVDSDLKDQDTLIEDLQLGKTTIDRYHRTSNARANTYYAGAALAYRMTPALALGFGLSYFNADELVQEYQYAKQSFFNDAGSLTKQTTLNSNVREHLVVHGVQPSIGVQAALPGNMSLGLTLRKGIVASQKYDVASETSIATLDANCNAVSTDETKKPMRCYAEGVTTTQSDNPVGDWPMEARLGVAWFASPTFLLAFDVSHYGAVTNADKLKSAGDRARYNKEAVTNLHLGMEYYLTASLPLRLGFFTNNDARPEVQKGDYQAGSATNTCSNKEFADKYCGQRDSIDYVGESIFIGWVQPNSQLAAGITLQQGTGKAQKLGDHQVQDVEASAYAFSFSATTTL